MRCGTVRNRVHCGRPTTRGRSSLSLALRRRRGSDRPSFRLVGAVRVLVWRVYLRAARTAVERGLLRQQSSSRARELPPWNAAVRPVNARSGFRFAGRSPQARSIGVLPGGELALRLASSALAQKPPTALTRREAGSGGHWSRLRGRSIISTGGARRLASASPIMCDRRLGIALFLRANSPEGWKVEDDDRHQTQRHSAQARRAESRWSRPPAVAGDRCQTAPECRSTRCWRDQHKPRRSSRSPLRLPHPVARLGTTSRSIGARLCERRLESPTRSR